MYNKPIDKRRIFMGKKITDKVTWVGKTDWELKSFHGNELSTHKGSSYNAYLIRDVKTVLIDTVWEPYDAEFVERLKNEIDLKKIDYIVMNHNEIDHSGALPKLLEEIPNTPIYCTNNGMKILKGHYHQDWNFVVVKTGDTLDLGESKLTFIEAPMLHWPDTMFTYMSGENILFSNDGFGQHFASESLFNDMVNESDLYYEALKYYANILCPFNQMVNTKVKEIIAMNLPIKMICPSHGVIWKDLPQQIIETYLLWSNAYKENQITIVYDTMWNSTRKMAEAIAEGIYKYDPVVKIKLMNASKDDKNDIITEIFRSKSMLMGSPTVNNCFLYSIGGLIDMIKGLRFKGKTAIAFGSYGWSGEVVKKLNEVLVSCGFNVVDPGRRVNWVPSEEDLESLRQYGYEIAPKL